MALPPGELRGCFDRLVPAPAAGALTRQQIVQLVAALRQSELSKSQCGKELLGWYDAYSASLGGT